MAENRLEPSVVVIGALNVDAVVRAPRLPAPGETVVGPRVNWHGGGKGANAAVAAARAGARTELVGAVGADDQGRSTLRELAAEGVDVGGVASLDDSATGVALIVVDLHAENQIAVGLGANADLSPEYVGRTVEARLGTAGCVLVSTEIAPGAVIAAVDAAFRSGVPVILNPAPVIPAVARCLGSADVITPNASEADVLLELLGGDASGSREKRWAELAERAQASVVVTLGAEGVAVAQPGEPLVVVPARPVRAIDTTGAGDTFNGVLAARVAAGDGMQDAVALAVAAASLSVMQPGARGGMPDFEAIVAFAGRG